MKTSMNKKAEFKYDHDDKVRFTSGQRWIMLFGLGLVVLAFVFGGVVGVPFLIALIVYLAVVSPRKKVSLTPRFMICGTKIIYYRTVSKIVLHRGDGILDLYKGDARVLQLNREKFPTGARKAPKIIKNKAAKFDKVSGKIIDKILEVCPDVQLQGVDRAALANKSPA